LHGACPAKEVVIAETNVPHGIPVPPEKTADVNRVLPDGRIAPAVHLDEEDGVVGFDEAFRREQDPVFRALDIYLDERL
jgi:hypothetical protein